MVVKKFQTVIVADLQNVCHQCANMIYNANNEVQTCAVWLTLFSDTLHVKDMGQYFSTQAHSSYETAMLQ
jgi:hypothetical protein